MPRGDSHKRVVDADWKSRRGDPIDGEEEIHRLEALDVEDEVYTTKLVENKIPDHVRTLNLYSKKLISGLDRERVGHMGTKTHLVRNQGRS